MYWTHNVLNSQCTELTMYWTNNVLNSQCTELTMYWTHSVLNSQCTELTMYWTHNVLNSRAEFKMYWTHNVLNSRAEFKMYWTHNVLTSQRTELTMFHICAYFRNCGLFVRAFLNAVLNMEHCSTWPSVATGLAIQRMEREERTTTSVGHYLQLQL